MPGGRTIFRSVGLGFPTIHAPVVRSAAKLLNRAGRLLIAAVFIGLVTLASGFEMGEAKSADSWLKQLAKDGKFRGVVLVARDGKPLFQKAYGLAIDGWNISNDLSTRFEIASLTKQFTCAAILQLAEAVKID